MIRTVLALAALAVVLVVMLPGTGAQKYVDECSNYTTCEECLNTEPGSNRQYCGWCHVNIVYQKGGIGGRCADIRDKPWKCPSIYDTAGCTAGYMCDYSSGECKKAKDGEGRYPTKEACEPYCYDTPKTFKCDTSNYSCVECTDPSDPLCSDKSTACANCTAPEAKFKCDRSDEKNPKCAQCPPQSTANCTDFKSACQDCYPPSPSPSPSPSPPPPPSPSPPGPSKKYKCNKDTFTCDEHNNGTIKTSCDAACRNSTPPEIVGTWRGFAAQRGFMLGEWDFNFTAEGDAIIRDPSGGIRNAHAADVEGLQITFTDGPDAGTVLKGIVQSLASSGPETHTIIIAFGAPNQPAPIDIVQALHSKNGETAYIMSACNAWKSLTCDFSSVFKKQLAIARRGALRTSLLRHGGSSRSVVIDAPPSLRDELPVHLSDDSDPCNALTNCSSCVAARFGDISCGWCFGGKIDYHKGTPTYQCGGFHKGKAPPFTCPSNFRTEDCSGYACSWNSTHPQCFTTDDGEFGDKDSCEQVCKPAEMARCNLKTKQCEPCNDKNCTMTMDQCEAICDQPRARCNTTTGKCESCDPESDPDCTQTKGACDTSCHVTSYGICDPVTGRCVECDPNKGQTGCVASCNSTCKAGGGYGCDNSTHTCTQNTGNMTLPDCAQECLPPHHDKGKYGCDWNAQGDPVCKEKLGNLTKQDCERNCHAPDFARCNYTSGQCEVCKRGDPDCSDTMAHCNLTCRTVSANGVYRGIEINKDFPIGEWDFTFFDDDVVAFELHSTSIKYEAKVDGSGSGKTGQPVSFTVTIAPSNGPLDIQVGDVLSGLFTQLDDEDNLTEVLYLGLGTPESAATDFDDAMTKFEWVLFKCRNKDACDFSPAALPE